MRRESFHRVRIASCQAYRLTRALALTAVLAGCADSPEPIMTQPSVGRVIQPIIGGTVSDGTQDYVVVLATFQNGVRTILCSATAVAPNLLLTARHCVSNAGSASACAADGTAVTGAEVKSDRSASDLVVFVGKDGVAPDSSVEANGATHGSSLVVEDTTALCNNDIAFVVLQKPIDVPIASIRLAAPTMAETVSAIGWGVDATGNLAKTREVRTGISLIGIGPGQYPDEPSYGYGTSEFMVGESTCAGDSGGPAIATTGAVVGVDARGGNGLPRDPSNYAATCIGTTAHAVFTHLGEHKDLIARAFQAAGAQPKLEVTPQVAAPVAAAPPPAPPSTEAAPKKDPLPPPTSDPPAAGGGCSMSSEPQTGSVEYAAGVVALLAMLLGLRRRIRAHREESAEPEVHRRWPTPRRGIEQASRERLPSIP